MKKLILSLLIPFIIFGKDLKIATYNVNNLFDTVYNKTEYDSYIPNTHNWNRSTLRKKLKNIAQVICELDADVVGLQEIENKNALNLLLKELNRRGCKYRYSAITNKKKSAIQVALISKVPIKRTKEIIVTRRFSDRNILEVELKTNPSLTIFVNHWRSQKAEEKARVRSAKALIERIKKLPKGKEYIILGDFNSEYNECIKKPELKICGIDTILRTTYKRRLIGLKDKPALSIYHYNLWSELPPYQRWSYDRYGKKSALDSIIISPTLNDKKGWRYKRGSFKVFKRKYLFKGSSSRLNRWEYKSSKHKGKGYSDHLPLYAIFTNGKRELKYESWLDKFWKMIIPEVKEKEKLEEITLKELKKVSSLKAPRLLKNVCVVYKRGDFGIIKSSLRSPSLTLYKSAGELREGRCYDLKVKRKKRYFKLDEITDLEVVKKRGRINVDKFIKNFKLSMLKEKNIGEIVKNIRGEYKRGYLKIGNRKVKLYVKEKKRGLLRSGNKLIIKRAQIGYYKGKLELIVHSLKDIKKEE
ncbi:MAG: hypothetical protein GXN91_01405 [Epsilonproteobacteria bacterium]|nr:hypothetical protein [Campylobacterota bacterium]